VSARARPERRQAILDAARDRFATSGYDGCSLRTIAAAAGVDPALVLYHYASKPGPYGAVLAREFSFVEHLGDAERASTTEAAARSWAAALRCCAGGPDTQACRALLRSAGSRDAEAITRAAVERCVGAAAGGAGGEAPCRAAHQISRLFGWILLREIVGVDELAGQQVETAAALLADPSTGRRP